VLVCYTPATPCGVRARQPISPTHASVRFGSPGPTSRARRVAPRRVVLPPAGGNHGGDIHLARRHARNLHGRQREPEPARPVKRQDISDLLSAPADRRGPEGTMGRHYRHPRTTRRDDGARTEVGVRLQQSRAASFDRQTWRTFVGDVGWELLERSTGSSRAAYYGASRWKGPCASSRSGSGRTQISRRLGGGGVFWGGGVVELPHTIAQHTAGVSRGKSSRPARGLHFGD